MNPLIKLRHMRGIDVEAVILDPFYTTIGIGYCKYIYFNGVLQFNDE